MILVAMPAYNEQKYIEGMVTKAKQYSGGVLVLDDGSTDNTEVLARKAGAQVIRHAKNLGHGAAIISILAEARKRTFDVLVTIDADSQHDPADIPRLVQPILNGYDLVIGSRSKDDIPTYRYVGGSVLSLFTRLLAGVNVVDSQCGFRAYSPKAVRTLELGEMGTAWCSEMIYEAAKKNLRIAEVPISIRYTEDGATLNPIRQGFGTLLRIMMMLGKRMIGK